MENKTNSKLNNIVLEDEERHGLLVALVLLVIVGITLNILRLGAGIYFNRNRKKSTIYKGLLVVLMLSVVVPMDIYSLGDAQPSSAILLCYIKDTQERVISGLISTSFALTSSGVKKLFPCERSIRLSRSAVSFVLLVIVFPLSACLADLCSHLQGYAEVVIKSFGKFSFCPTVNSVIVYKCLGILFVDIVPFVYYIIQNRKQNNVVNTVESIDASDGTGPTYNVPIISIITWTSYVFLKGLSLFYYKEIVCVFLVVSKVFVCLMHPFTDMWYTYEICCHKRQKQEEENAEEINTTSPVTINIESELSDQHIETEYNDENLETEHNVFNPEILISDQTDFQNASLKRRFSKLSLQNVLPLRKFRYSLPAIKL